MTKATTRLTMAVAMAMALAAPARGQGADPPIKKGFVSVYAGAQPQRRTVTATTSFPLYEETATITSNQRIRNGALIQVGGGVRVRGPLAVGVRFSMFGRPGTSSVSAVIPDPIFFSRPKTVTADASSVEHTERGVHINAVWLVPTGSRFDIALSAGPSIIHVSQELTSVSVQPGTQNIAVVKAAETGNAMGFNAGLDATYRITPQYGAGIFVHYAAGSVDLASAPGFEVGGVQAGVGFHVRF